MSEPAADVIVVTNLTVIMLAERIFQRAFAPVGH
jgi:hypothetical protein